MFHKHITCLCLESKNNNHIFCVLQREVTDDMILADMKKQKDTAVPGAVKIPAPAPVKPAPKYGLRGRLAEPKPEPKKPAVKRVGFAGKENLTRAKPVAKVGGDLNMRKWTISIYLNEQYLYYTLFSLYPINPLYIGNP